VYDYGMVRVPTTFSLRFLEVFPDDEPEAELTYDGLSPLEIDFLIIRCRRGATSFRRESRHPETPRAEAAKAALESVRTILKDLLQVAPEVQRAKIQAILDQE
jgi:hypothetical protein